MVKCLTIFISKYLLLDVTRMFLDVIRNSTEVISTHPYIDTLTTLSTCKELEQKWSGLVSYSPGRSTGSAKLLVEWVKELV